MLRRIWLLEMLVLLIRVLVLLIRLLVLLVRLLVQLVRLLILLIRLLILLIRLLVLVIRLLVLVLLKLLVLWLELLVLRLELLVLRLELLVLRLELLVLLRNCIQLIRLIYGKGASLILLLIRHGNRLQYDRLSGRRRCDVIITTTRGSRGQIHRLLLQYKRSLLSSWLLHLSQLLILLEKCELLLVHVWGSLGTVTPKGGILHRYARAHTRRRQRSCCSILATTIERRRQAGRRWVLLAVGTTNLGVRVRLPFKERMLCLPIHLRVHAYTLPRWQGLRYATWTR
jgi:hypothetical protein